MSGFSWTPCTVDKATCDLCVCKYCAQSSLQNACADQFHRDMSIFTAFERTSIIWCLSCQGHEHIFPTNLSSFDISLYTFIPVTVALYCSGQQGVALWLVKNLLLEQDKTFYVPQIQSDHACTTFPLHHFLQINARLPIQQALTSPSEWQHMEYPIYLGCTIYFRRATRML